MEKRSETELKQIANSLRKNVINMLECAKSGHPGGSLGMADVFTLLYFDVLNLDPKNPNDPTRWRDWPYPTPAAPPCRHG